MSHYIMYRILNIEQNSHSKYSYDVYFSIYALNKIISDNLKHQYYFIMLFFYVNNIYYMNSTQICPYSNILFIRFLTLVWLVFSSICTALFVSVHKNANVSMTESVLLDKYWIIKQILIWFLGNLKLLSILISWYCFLINHLFYLKKLHSECHCFW